MTNKLETRGRRRSASKYAKAKGRARQVRQVTKPTYKQMMSMRGHHRPFVKARAFVRKLGLRSYQEWLAYCQGRLKGKQPKPLDIPQNPRDTYREDGWAGFADWLGTGNIAYRNHQWRAFRPARAFVRRLKLPHTRAWRDYVRGDMPYRPALPKDIPTNPDRVYAKTDWNGFGDWLGNPAPRKKSRIR